MAVKLSLLLTLQQMVSRPVCASISSQMPIRATFAASICHFLSRYLAADKPAPQLPSCWVLPVTAAGPRPAHLTAVQW